MSKGMAREARGAMVSVLEVVLEDMRCNGHITTAKVRGQEVQRSYFWR